MATVAAWTCQAAAANPQSPKNEHQIPPKRHIPNQDMPFLILRLSGEILGDRNKNIKNSLLAVLRTCR